MKELSGYPSRAGKVRLGANVVYQQFLEDETLRRHLPCMPYCAVWFADDQIRQQATLAGNLVNASPAADGTPPVLAMDGEIEMARLKARPIDTRTMSVDRLHQRPGQDRARRRRDRYRRDLPQLAQAMAARSRRLGSGARW